MRVPVRKLHYYFLRHNKYSLTLFTHSFSHLISALEQLTKSEHYANTAAGNATSVSGNGSSANYQTYTNKSAGTVYQQTGVAPQTYSNSNYANTQVSNSSNYPSATNTYSSYNQASVNSYQTQQQSNLSNSVNNSSSATSVANSGSVQNIPVGSNSAVNNSR